MSVVVICGFTGRAQKKGVSSSQILTSKDSASHENSLSVVEPIL